MKRKIAIAISLAILFAPLAVHAKTTEDKVRELEQRIGMLQKTYMQNNQSTASAVAQTQAIHDEWNIMKGKVDANTQLIRMQHTDLMGMMTELDHRIQAIEDRMQIFSSQLSKALAKVAPEAAAEGELYQKGLDLASQAKYLEAAAAFEKFLGKYKKSQFAPNALFWVGECFYSMRDYKRAIKEYQRFIEKYPRDKNVSMSILNQGNSFYELGMLDEAKAFYQKVIQTYPASQAASMAKAKLARIEEKQNQAEQPSAGLGSYPGETLEQKRMRLNGQPSTPPAEAPKKTNPKRKSTIGDF